MKRWAVVDGDGYCVNVVLWDGESEWTPPADCTAINLAENPALTYRPTFDTEPDPT